MSRGFQATESKYSVKSVKRSAFHFRCPSSRTRKADNSKANRRDVYHITLKWDPQQDDICISDDTGNKGLRDGILMDFLRQLN